MENTNALPTYPGLHIQCGLEITDDGIQPVFFAVSPYGRLVGKVEIEFFEDGE